MDLRIAGLFQQGAHDFGALQDVASAAGFEERHHVIEITQRTEIEVLVTFGQRGHRGSGRWGVAHVLPFVSHLS
jgi:hypothetical protein